MNSGHRDPFLLASNLSRFNVAIQCKHTYSNAAIERGHPGTRMDAGLAQTASYIYIFLFIYIYKRESIFFYSPWLSLAQIKEGVLTKGKVRC